VRDTFSHSRVHGCLQLVITVVKPSSQCLKNAKALQDRVHEALTLAAITVFPKFDNPALEVCRVYVGGVKDVVDDSSRNRSGCNSLPFNVIHSRSNSSCRDELEFGRELSFGRVVEERRIGVLLLIILPLPKASFNNIGVRNGWVCLGKGLNSSFSVDSLSLLLSLESKFRPAEPNFDKLLLSAFLRKMRLTSVMN
jgi:hypothetical protein